MTLLLGLIVGVLFGLTGNGSMLAVPLLVFGLHLRPHAAVCTSMIAVGAMAAARAFQNTRAGSVDNRLGWRIAFGGLAGAPVGALIGRHLSERWLLLLFATLVLIVAVRLWSQKSHASSDASGSVLQNAGAKTSARQFWLLASLGLGTGMISGLLGVGGGFILIPGLVLLGGLEIHRAMTTAMFTVALVSGVAMAAHFFAGQRVSLETTGLFTMGGLIGLWPGTWLAARCSSVLLARVLAVGLLLLGAFIVVHSFVKG